MLIGNNSERFEKSKLKFYQSLKDRNYIPLEKYKGMRNCIWCKNKFGIIKVYPEQFVKGGKPRTNRAKNKTLYFKNEISEIFPFEINGEYINNQSVFECYCKIHGLFHKSAQRIRLGQGCPFCGNLQKRFTTNLKHANIFKAEYLKHKCIVYKVHLFNEDESFFKIGITKNTLKQRMRGNTL